MAHHLLDRGVIQSPRLKAIGTGTAMPFSGVVCLLSVELLGRKSVKGTKAPSFPGSVVEPAVTLSEPVQAYPSNKTLFMFVNDNIDILQIHKNTSQIT